MFGYTYCPIFWGNNKSSETCVDSEKKKDELRDQFRDELREMVIDRSKVIDFVTRKTI